MEATNEERTQQIVTDGTVQYWIAKDGMKCTDEETMVRYEAFLDEVDGIRERTGKLAAAKRISPAWVKEFYELWKACGGYRNKFGFLRKEGLSDLKDRLMQSALRKARREGWERWRNDEVVYVTTPNGQASWHVQPSWSTVCVSTADGREQLQAQSVWPDWIRRIPETAGGQEWDGRRNSDLVLRRMFGESGPHLDKEEALRELQYLAERLSRHDVGPARALDEPAYMNGLVKLMGGLLARTQEQEEAPHEKGHWLSHRLNDKSSWETTIRQDGLQEDERWRRL